MNYYKIYQKRLLKDGKTPQERIRTFGRKEYENFIKQSPTRRILVTNEGCEIECSFQSNKFKDTENLKYVVCRYNEDIPLGTLLTDTETGEIWITIQHNPHPFGIDNRYVVLQCKHFIKWVNEYGVIQQTPCRIVGTTDSKIKENFRTWNNMITPQPNKNLEIICPYYKIPKNTKIIINDEAWYLVDYDKTSIEGVIYLSLTESMINPSDDDLNNQIADANRIGEYEIRTYVGELQLRKNRRNYVYFKLYKKGIETNEILTIKNEYDPSNVIIDENYLYIKEYGTYMFDIYYPKDENVKTTIKIIVQSFTDSSERFIIGSDVIKWGQSTSYKLGYYKNGIYENPYANFYLEGNEEELVSLKRDGNGCILTANDENKVGYVTLIAKTENNTIVLNKKIRVSSIWS